MKDVERDMEEKRQRFMNEMANCKPGVNTADVESVQAMRSMKQQGKPAIYRDRNSEIGKGTYGTVSVVRNVSSGTKYAGKAFNGEFGKIEADMLQKMDHARPP